MSDPRIGLVGEGETDRIIIEAALRAILGTSILVNRLQPEPTPAMLGTGWSGVLKWCDAAGARHPGAIDTDPTLPDFDLLIIHLDVDVALENYANAGNAVVARALNKPFGVLPCAQPCPPVDISCASLLAVLTTWLAPATVGAKTVLCLPAQSSGTWLAAATLPVGHALLANVECNPNVEANLGTLAKALKIKKQVTSYRAHASLVTKNWDTVKALCTQAVEFENAVLSAI